MAFIQRSSTTGNHGSISAENILYRYFYRLTNKITRLNNNHTFVDVIPVAQLEAMSVLSICKAATKQRCYSLINLLPAGSSCKVACDQAINMSGRGSSASRELKTANEKIISVGGYL